MTFDTEQVKTSTTQIHVVAVGRSGLSDPGITWDPALLLYIIKYELTFLLMGKFNSQGLLHPQQKVKGGLTYLYSTKYNVSSPIQTRVTASHSWSI